MRVCIFFLEKTAGKEYFFINCAIFNKYKLHLEH